MTNGFYFDLYALAFAAGIAGMVGLFWGLRGKLRGRRRPFDWAKDAPEYGRAKDAHVRLVDEWVFTVWK